MRVVVVVPARDEEQRVAACLTALAGQGAHVVLVDDGSTDATVAVAERTAHACGLSLEVVAGPRRGVGHARRLGMEVAAERLRGAGSSGGSGGSGSSGSSGSSGEIIASTDADSRVAPDWLARIEARIARGAAAVGGRIALDAEEAALLPPEVLQARAAEAERRLAAVREHTPEAEHHQFSGASLALTLAAHDAIGGLPAVVALEDEALERALRSAGLPIAYAADVRVTTSARTSGHVPRGLAQVLRTASWKAAGPSSASPGGTRSTITVHRTGSGDAEALRAAADGDAEVVLSLGPGVEDATALLEAITGDVLLARAAEPQEDPLELVARPALNLHAPELAILTSPLTRTWAIRRELLAELPLPHGAALDLTVLLDTWTRHGLGAIAERPLEAPAREHADTPLAAYEILAAMTTRFPEPPPLSSAYASPAGTRRARLDELPAGMTRLLLVRHGESTWNAAKRWQGQADPPLSATGEEQARAARAAASKEGPFDRIHCSPLQRARRTAELLDLGTPEPVRGLEERAAGAWTGLTHAEIDARWPGARQGTWRPDDYETEEALRTRATAALATLDGTCLVVVHEGLLRALDRDPAPIPNLGARWFTGGGEPDGPRFALTRSTRPSPHHPGSS